MHQVSLKTVCLSKAFLLHYCADNDAKSMVKHLIFLQKFAVISSCRLILYVDMLVICIPFLFERFMEMNRDIVLDGLVLTAYKLVNRDGNRFCLVIERDFFSVTLFRVAFVTLSALSSQSLYLYKSCSESKHRNCYCYVDCGTYLAFCRHESRILG